MPRKIHLDLPSKRQKQRQGRKAQSLIDKALYKAQLKKTHYS